MIRELRLLARGLKTVLSYALLNVPVTTANAALKAIGLPDAGFTLHECVYGVGYRSYIRGAADAVMWEMITPLLGGITNDAFVPEDLNAKLEPYGESAKDTGGDIEITTPGSIFSAFKKLFNVFISCMKTLLLPWC